MLSEAVAHIEQFGYARIVDAFSAKELRPAERTVAALSSSARGLLEKRAVRSIALSDAAKSIVQVVLGFDFVPVRALFFFKDASNNWGVPWHQDVTIPVDRQIEIPGFSGWTRKGGVPHVQPPASILERMVALRFHLDDSPADGGLQVVPRSHRAGRLSVGQIAECTERQETVSCPCNRGDILVMRPLLVHSSLRAQNPRSRRVLHVEYAVAELPAPLAFQPF